MRRAIILLGAGASVEYKALSTPALTDAIEREVLADPWMIKSGGAAAFADIKSRLKSYLEGQVNFEQIYHCAHELRFAFPPTPGAVDEFKPIMQPFLSHHGAPSQNALEELCAKIVAIIFRVMSESCETNPLGLEPLARFFETLRANYVTRVYTTNYDDFVLQAASDFYLGFGAAISGVRRFDLNRFWHRERWDGLFHLHGSVHMGYQTPHQGEFGELFWFNDRADALTHSAFRGSSPNRMDGTSVLRTAVITGLEKLSRVQQRPFAHFYSMMARDAMRADVIFVIGSGLADLHLNTWLGEARSRTPRPPLLFIDFWPNSFEQDTYFELEQKTIELFHKLHVHVSEQHRGTRVGNWILSQDRTSAIWDRGFQAFLNAPDQLQAAMTALKGAIPPALHRLSRRAYREWSKYTHTP